MSWFRSTRKVFFSVPSAVNDRWKRTIAGRVRVCVVRVAPLCLVEYGRGSFLGHDAQALEDDVHVCSLRTSPDTVENHISKSPATAVHYLGSHVRPVARHGK